VSTEAKIMKLTSPEVQLFPCLCETCAETCLACTHNCDWMHDSRWPDYDRLCTCRAVCERHSRLHM